MERSRWNDFFLTLSVLVIAGAAKFIQYSFLPAKYFYDSNAILRMMSGNLEFELQSAYTLTAIFSRSINILRLNSLLQWSVFYAVILNLVIIIILNQIKVENSIEYVWVLASVGLVNIYVFNLSKDVFQFILFLLGYAVILSNVTKTKKVLLSISMFLIWGVIFRKYFIIIAAYVILSYLTILHLRKNKSQSFIVFLIVIIIGVFLSLILTSVFMPDEYSIIINVHHKLTVNRVDSQDAMTLICDVLNNNNGNLFIYILNYGINLIRMMVPLELVLKMDLKYLMFFAYQMAITILVIKRAKLIFLKESSDEQILAFSVYLGFLLGSALFEPDFGSWVRHESSTFPILLIVFFDTRETISAKINKRTSSRYIRKNRKGYKTLITYER